MTASSEPPVRAFIAIHPGEAVRAELIRLQGHLERVLAGSPFKIKWVEPEAMHLTLHFLGDQPVERLKTVFQTLEKTAAGFPEFGITLAGAGCFGQPDAPRVLWAGLTAPPELFRLHQQLAGMLAGIGIEPEGRPFHPHLTLGRVKAGRGMEVFQALRKTHVEPLAFEVSSVGLIRSERMPAGPEYTVLGTAPFRPGAR